MHSTDWTEERRRKVTTLIPQLYAAAATLQAEFQRAFTPDGHMVGSIGEVVAAYAFDLDLFRASTAIHDAVARDGTRVQVKLTGGNCGVALYSEPKHLIVLQLVANKFSVVYNGPGAAVWEKCGRAQKNGQRSIRIAALKKLDQQVSPKISQVREFPELTRNS